MILNFIKYGTAIFLLSMSISCDILRSSPFEVLHWSPGGGYHDRPEDIKLSLSFSQDPDRASVEKYFSITADAETVHGIFHWEERTMYYMPFVPLQSNKEYSMRVFANAQSTKMLSMDRDFEGRFSTRADSSRPRIVSVQPEMDGIIRESRGICSINFSTVVSIDSVRSGVSLFPSIPGVWDLEEGGHRAVFRPAEPWPQGRRFEMRISSSVSGENGMSMGEEYFSVFTIGENRNIPDLIGAWRITGAGEQIELSRRVPEVVFENSGWERTDSLRLVFSAPVDLLSVKAALLAEGVSLPVLDISFAAAPLSSQALFSDEAIFRFEQPPAYASRFSLRLRKGIKDMHGNESTEEYLFTVVADGANSKPPSLVGIRIPMSPNGQPDDAVDYQMVAYSLNQLFAGFPVESMYYPYAEGTATWVELYFDSAPGAFIDPFSLMELFRMETSNNVMHFSPQLVRMNGFIAVDPHPLWESFQRLEITGMLTNTVNAGIVHFIVNQGLKDSLGNISEQQYRISLVK